MFKKLQVGAQLCHGLIACFAFFFEGLSYDLFEPSSLW